MPWNKGKDIAYSKRKLITAKSRTCGVSCPAAMLYKSYLSLGTA
uniref:Uncharacterized protein n=1 Tax=Anguilla anguilla TaxID=7936 RepID=A0A0E9XLP5_ANGAN